MAYEDILGGKERKKEETYESIIESMRYNLEEKQKIIEDLTDKIINLEKQLEVDSNIYTEYI